MRRYLEGLGNDGGFAPQATGADGNVQCPDYEGWAGRGGAAGGGVSSTLSIIHTSNSVFNNIFTPNNTQNLRGYAMQYSN